MKKESNSAGLHYTFPTASSSHHITVPVIIKVFFNICPFLEEASGIFPYLNRSFNFVYVICSFHACENAAYLLVYITLQTDIMR